VNIKNLIITIVFVGILGGLGLGSLLIPDTDVSVSERRPLKQFTSYEEAKAEADKKGEEFGIAKYFSSLESYMLDQFPGRDTFRSMKSVFKKYFLLQKDNNGYYYVDGTLSKVDGTLSETALDEAITRFNYIYDKYFANKTDNIYFTLVPDKNYFVAEANGYLHYDYDKLKSILTEKLNDVFFPVDIFGKLTIEDYYRTDTHWDQSKIKDVADTILAAMQCEKGASDYTWTENVLEGFKGTYFGQAALPVKPDKLTYLTGAHLDGVTVSNIDINEATGLPKATQTTLYNEEYFGNTDPYDVFLDGATPILHIKNPNATSDKQLVVFRDSFGSSLTPLLVSEYAEILVLDIRYIHYTIIETVLSMQKITFQKDCDVLFLYSTFILNSNGAFK